MRRDFYTPAQLAESIGVKVDAVLAWIAAGDLRASNVGQGQHRPRWRISADALDAFLAARANRQQPRQARRRREALPQFV